MICEVDLLDAVVVELGYPAIALPQNAIAVGWHTLLLACVEGVGTMIVLVGRLEGDGTLLELAEEHVLVSVFHRELLVDFELLKSQVEVVFSYQLLEITAANSLQHLLACESIYAKVHVA